ncbi:MAG: prmC [Flavipsychrobacter sp.]|jgi:release factor glutamine methyltransferase|nr:prmC [Flavipsychrobacter sp.]
MLTYNQAFYQLKELLQPLYDPNEAAAISHLLLEHITGLTKMERLDKRDILFTEEQQQLFDGKAKELIRGKPIQYVTNSAWFLGKEFYVNEQVLIPRPETEELTAWITQEITNHKSQIINILDIGTGSGCIPISLKLALPHSNIASCDISVEALKVAQVNASRLNAAINFLQLDFLDFEEHNNLGIYDVIVSNPPYIPAEEKERLHSNVRDYEPALALFVPDNDALVFYKAIAFFGKDHLGKNGSIYCELDAAHAEECSALFEAVGYKNVEIKKDMHGNWRMLKAELGIGNQE